jgi:hypothetical protein
MALIMGVFGDESYGSLALPNFFLMKFQIMSHQTPWKIK